MQCAQTCSSPEPPSHTCTDTGHCKTHCVHACVSRVSWPLLPTCIPPWCKGTLQLLRCRGYDTADLAGRPNHAETNMITPHRQHIVLSAIRTRQNTSTLGTHASPPWIHLLHTSRPHPASSSITTAAQARSGTRLCHRSTLSCLLTPGCKHACRLRHVPSHCSFQHSHITTHETVTTSPLAQTLTGSHRSYARTPSASPPSELQALSRARHAGQARERERERLDADLDVARQRVLVRPVAPAAAAGDEDHAGRRDLRQAQARGTLGHPSAVC